MINNLTWTIFDPGSFAMRNLVPSWMFQAVTLLKQLPGVVETFGEDTSTFSGFVD